MRPARLMDRGVRGPTYGKTGRPPLWTEGPNLGGDRSGASRGYPDTAARSVSPPARGERRAPRSPLYRGALHVRWNKPRGPRKAWRAAEPA
jgi:hypothetical protein